MMSRARISRGSATPGWHRRCVLRVTYLFRPVSWRNSRVLSVSNAARAARDSHFSAAPNYPARVMAVARPGFSRWGARLGPAGQAQRHCMELRNFRHFPSPLISGVRGCEETWKKTTPKKEAVRKREKKKNHKTPPKKEPKPKPTATHHNQT